MIRRLNVAEHRPGLVAVAVTLSTASACGGGDDGASDQMTRADDGTPAGDELELGRQVYGDNCAVCHGKSGGGGIGPKLSGGRVVEQYPDIEDHRRIVVNGRGRMPAWGDRLSDEEIDAVVGYERDGL